MILENYLGQFDLPLNNQFLYHKHVYTTICIYGLHLFMLIYTVSCCYSAGKGRRAQLWEGTKNENVVLNSSNSFQVKS